MGIRDPLERERIAELCARLDRLLRVRDVGLLLCDVGGATSPSCDTVEALARLRLLARRHGCGFRVLSPGDGLRDLLSLVGLDEVLLVESGGEPEEREQPRRVEEEGEAADPPG